MKTNKPGTVTQQPLFGCASCYDDVSYPADHLHVYNGECWCENCWEYATHEIADGRDWSKLEPFKPALQVECERWKRGSEIRDEQNQDLHSFIMELKAECGKLRAALAESRANDLTAMGYLNQIRQLVGGDDFPDMVRRCEKLRAECEKLRAAMIEAKGHISHYMYGGSSYREPAAKAIELIDAALAAHRQGDEE